MKIYSLYVKALDYIAARAGLWAMNRLYGGGCSPPYEEGCVGCDVGRMVGHLEKLLVDLRKLG
jgi:hypothetical protein